MKRGYASMSLTNMNTTNMKSPNTNPTSTNPMSANATNELTIVIPAKNEAKLIPRLLTSLTNQDYSKMRNTRVLVADANSTDGTAEIVLGFRDRLDVCVIRG